MGPSARVHGLTLTGSGAWAQAHGPEPLGPRHRPRPMDGRQAMANDLSPWAWAHGICLSLRVFVSTLSDLVSDLVFETRVLSYFCDMCSLECLFDWVSDLLLVCFSVHDFLF